MKKILLIISFLISLIMLIGCSAENGGENKESSLFSSSYELTSTSYSNTKKYEYQN